MVCRAAKRSPPAEAPKANAVFGSGHEYRLAVFLVSPLAAARAYPEDTGDDLRGFGER
jgi:hypothetical protein